MVRRAILKFSRIVDRFAVTGVGGGGANVKQYWMADVVEMAEKMAKLQEAVNKGSPDSAQAIEDFKSKQIARVEARFEVSVFALCANRHSTQMIAGCGSLL